MSKEKAKEFIKYLIAHPDLADMMKGFTHTDLKNAAEELREESTQLDLDHHFPF